MRLGELSARGREQRTACPNAQPKRSIRFPPSVSLQCGQHSRRKTKRRDDIRIFEQLRTASQPNSLTTLSEIPIHRPRPQPPCQPSKLPKASRRRRIRYSFLLACWSFVALVPVAVAYIRFTHHPKPATAPAASPSLGFSTSWPSTGACMLSRPSHR